MAAHDPSPLVSATHMGKLEVGDSWHCSSLALFQPESLYLLNNCALKTNHRVFLNEKAKNITKMELKFGMT